MQKRRYFYEITGERARELLFLYGSKGEFLIRPSESSAQDYTLSIHRGTRVTHVKIPFDSATKVYRLPTGQEFQSIDTIVPYLEAHPKLLSEADGFSIEVTSSVQIPIAETVVYIGRDRYFHISTKGQDAENLLNDEPCGTYLVRESGSNEGEFAISVKNSAEKIVHVRISHHNGRYRIVPKDNFRTLTDLLDNYIRMPMVQNGGNPVRLKTPMPSTKFTAATIDDRIDCLLRSSKKSGMKDGFVDEFEGLHREEDSQMFISCKEGRRSENVRKNRYRNVVPFDHTRIKLKSTGAEQPIDKYNDYINANYVEVPLDAKRYPEFSDFKRRYISTQGCLEETVQDFWQMVWQENSRLIVMVTKEVERGRVKCYRYWPNLEEESAYGRLMVRTVQERKNDDYMERVLVLRQQSDPPESGRRIFQFQILSWEDNDACPVESVLSFLDVFNECERKQASAGSRHGPPVVHCSAGIGRTGTFLALDILINRIKQKGPQCVCDVQKTVRMLREQRATMVQTEAQYRFIFYVISAFVRTFRASHQFKLNSDEGQLPEIVTSSKTPT